MNKYNNEFQNLNLKNKRNHRKKKNDNNNKENKEKKIKIENNENPKEELTEEEKFIEEIIEIKDKLRDLKILFSKNESKDLYEDKIQNFILIEKLIDYSKIKAKIIECFPCEDIFNYLFEAWKKILYFSSNNNTNSIKNNEIIKNENFEDLETATEEKKDKKNKKKSLGYYFNKLLMNLDFFIPKILTNEKDDSFKNKIIDTIIPNIQIIKGIEDGENFLYYFINIFNLKKGLKMLIEKENKEKFKEIVNNHLCLGLNLINILDLQKIFPLEEIFKIICDNYYLISYNIYSLMARAYIQKDEKKKFLITDKLLNLIGDDKNLVNYRLVYDIINNDFKNDNKKNELLLKFINNLKINFDKHIPKNILDNSIYYCKLVFENDNLFTKTEIEQAQKYICEQYFNDLKPKDWKDNIAKLNLFEYNDLKRYLFLDNLETFYYKLPLINRNIDIFIEILKFIPKEIPKLLNDLKKENNYDAGVRIIKALDYPEHKIPEYFKKERIYKFFNYKIAVCKDENNPHTLIEYCLISQKNLDVAILQLINKYKKFYFKDSFFLYVINEVYYGAFDKQLKFTKTIQKEIEGLYNKINYVDNYTFKDHFGPVEKNCIQIDLEKTNIFFINNINEFEKILNKYFSNSKYIGIDSEWQQSFRVKDNIDISIMQLSTDDEKCCVILDMLKLKWEDKFFDIFKKYLKGKIFVGFSFDKNDMAVLPKELKDFFCDSNNCTVHDLVVIYKQKYLEKCQSLKIITENILEKSICKYEQCSDWNIRPLTKCQIHYAALDALVCILLYKKIVLN